jgi:ketosteroid isomerase-like protein
MAREPHLEEMLHQELPDDELGVQDFLDRFGTALTAGDGAAIAEMWETPAFVLGEGMARVVSTREEVEDFFAGAKEQYNELGITDTKPQIVRLDEINDHLVMVRVRWPYLDAQGMERGAETSTYTLTREGDGDWKFRITVMQGAEKPN